MQNRNGDSMTEATIRYDLAALREEASAACILARSISFCEADAVNWADLQCKEAAYYETDSGESGHYVTIEEADPTAWRLQNFIRNHLHQRSFFDVEVRTEW